MSAWFFGASSTITRGQRFVAECTLSLLLIVLHGSPGLSQPASIWNHNGSLMSLQLVGDQVRLVYVQPRPGMIDAGARAGSQLFDGRLQGTRVLGLARIFVWQCGQFPYQVDGEVTNNGTHITLKGEAPWVERATCAIKGSTPDVLNFDLRSGAPIPIASTSTAPRTSDTGRTAVALTPSGGTLTVPVVINGALQLGFVIDSGAADVVVPIDVVMTLLRTGTLRDGDFLGSQTYVLADGSRLPSRQFRIRSLKVGDTVLQDVTGSVSPVSGEPLLGQSFLGRFHSWSIDNSRGVLVLE
jgi:hypothetical protein